MEKVVGFDLEVEIDGHVTAKHTHELAHPGGIDPAIWLVVEVVPGVIEMGGQVVIGLLSVQIHMGSNHFARGGHSIWLLQDEVAGFFTALVAELLDLGGLLGGILLEHGPHELVVALAWAIEVLGDLSLVVSETFPSLVLVHPCWESWVLLILGPGGGNVWVASDLELDIVVVAIDLVVHGIKDFVCVQVLGLSGELHILWPDLGVLHVVVITWLVVECVHDVVFVVVLAGE